MNYTDDGKTPSMVIIYDNDSEKQVIEGLIQIYLERGRIVNSYEIEGSGYQIDFRIKANRETFKTALVNYLENPGKDWILGD